MAVATTLRRPSRTISRAVLGVGRPPTTLKDSRVGYVVVRGFLCSAILSVFVPDSDSRPCQTASYFSPAAVL